MRYDKIQHVCEAVEAIYEVSARKRLASTFETLYNANEEVNSEKACLLKARYHLKFLDSELYLVFIQHAMTGEVVIVVGINRKEC